jgi:hypothetical protein
MRKTKLVDYNVLPAAKFALGEEVLISEDGTPTLARVVGARYVDEEWRYLVSVKSLKTDDSHSVISEKSAEVEEISIMSRKRLVEMSDLGEMDAMRETALFIASHMMSLYSEGENEPSPPPWVQPLYSELLMQSYIARGLGFEEMKALYDDLASGDDHAKAS